MLLPILLALLPLARCTPTPFNHNGHASQENNDAKAILDATLHAIGGAEALQAVNNFVFQSSNIFRSHTLGQNYNLFLPDQSVAAAGNQTMTFDMTGNGLRSRIDRSYVYDDYWIWAFPNLKPDIDFSLVVDDTDDGWACFVKGQNSFYSADPTMAAGYVDSYLADYLVHHSRQFALPWLLLHFMADIKDVRVTTATDPASGREFAELIHDGLELSLLLDKTTHLVYAVRSTEVHPIFGNSTSDVVLSSWSDENFDNTSILLPHRLQTVYNSDSVIEDALIDSIRINAVLPADLFVGKPPLMKSQCYQHPHHPAVSTEYPRGEVHEFFESGLWDGPFTSKISDVVVHHPIDGIKEIMTVYVGDYPDYVQVLVELDDGLIITDAAPHRSRIILEWVEANMKGKRITHVVPSHHHRDHAGGVPDYIAAGATLVVPEVAVALYNYTGQVRDIQTYREDNPFVLQDKNVDFRAYWKASNPHAEDWSFAVVKSALQINGMNSVVFNADVVSPGSDALRWDTGAAREFLIQAVEIGLSPETVLVGAHGSSEGGTSTSELLGNIAEIAGFPYPAMQS